MQPSSKSKKKRRSRNPGNKISLSTSSNDYGGTLGLPEKISQREFESTGQFFQRLNRLVAKAKVEASMESRFDMSLAKAKKSQESKPKPKAKKPTNSDQSEVTLGVMKRPNQLRDHPRRKKSKKR